MSVNKFTTNNNPTLVAVSNSDGETPVYLYADPSTHGLVVSATVTSSGGAILDGVDSNIKATVVDYVNSNPLTVRLTDTNGDYVAAGAGTQYTAGGTPPANPVGGAIEWDEGGTWRTVSAAKPLPVTATFAPSGTQDVNLTKVAGASISQGHGTAAAAIRVELPTDGTGLVSAAQSGTWNVTNVSGTVSLPTGAATAALQTTGNTSLGTIDTSTAASKTDLDTIASAVRAEDTASADADKGIGALAIRKATPANTSGTDGDYEYLQMSAGRLWASATIDAALPAGANVIGHVISDSGSVTNATLTAETTKVIGVTRTADGAGNLLTTNSTTYTAKFGLDGNLLGTLGTAFSTAGKVDVKAADGDVFVRQATASNLNATVVGTGTFVVQATLAAETTKVIGVVRTADGSGNLLTSSSNALDVNLKTSSITLAVSLATNTPSGSVAHDGVGTGVNPLLIGGYASAAAPADVSNDGDATRVWLLRSGAQATQPTFAGVLGSTGAGASGTGTQRVVTATDSTIGTVTTITNVVHVDDNAGSLTVDNAGTFAVQATIAAGATTIGKAEDAVHSTGDVGVPALAVRDDTLNATSGTEGDYEMLHTTAEGGLWVTAIPSTTGGWSPAFNAAVTTTVKTVKAGVGTLGGWFIYNPNSSVAYVQIFDIAGAVTLGTSVPVLSLGIPATSGANVESPNGVQFVNAIKFACTTTSTGLTAPSTGLEVNFWFK